MNKALLSKRGFTLVEVMMATIILGIMTIAGSAYFAHAARARMMARGIQASLIEASSLMERAFEASDVTLYSNVLGSTTGYLTRDMVYKSSKPSEVWTFDGDSTLPVLIELTPVEDLQALNIMVTVTPPRGPKATLLTIRCCE
jgi:prepilin-type N-terminal cleavage/methylation domain-containing protein